MKRALIIVIALGLLFSSTELLANDSIVTVNYQWYQDNYDYVLETIQRGDEREVIPIVNTIGSIWRNRDGAIWIEVAPAIAQALLYVPNPMLLWFHSHQSEFETWIEDLPDALLTDYMGQDGNIEKLKRLREQLINGLSEYRKKESDQSLNAMADRLIGRLKSTEVSTVK
jgi:hypothetical protein